MRTLKLKIKSCDNVKLLSEYVSEYTGAYYKLFNNLELSQDSIFINSLSNKFCALTIESLIKNTQIKFKQITTQKEKTQKLIENLKKDLVNFDKKKLTKKQSKLKFKIIQKIAFLSRSVNKGICFGGKSLLRKITLMENSLKYLNDSDKLNKQKLIDQKKLEFKERRQIPIFLIGQSLSKSNRRINFDLKNCQITYKPNSKEKINIEFCFSRNYKIILSKLQECSKNSELPITVSISNNYVYITYDEAKLNGLNFDKNQLRKLQKNSISEKQSKDIYKTFIKEHEQYLLKNKFENCVGAIDLNPNFIGFSITDFNKNKVLYSVCYDLQKLNKKTKLASDKNQYQTNKRKHELIEIYKDIFQKCTHFKVSIFSIEDLNFKVVLESRTEFNRLTKNVWNRTLQENQINKHCNALGIKLIKVNPMYSSFMGNLIFKDYDPIASSRMIAERAQNKYTKGFKILGGIERIDQEKLDYLLGKNISNNYKSWKQLYSEIGELPYRNKVVNQSKNFKSNKSRVILTI